MASDSYPCTLVQFQYSTETPIDSTPPAYQQCPWQEFAFCSGLGTLEYLAVFKQTRGVQQRRERLYQKHLITQIIKNDPTSALGWLTQPTPKIAGMPTTLLFLTPMTGNPVSYLHLSKKHKIYLHKIYLKEGQIG